MTQFSGSVRGREQDIVAVRLSQRLQVRIARQEISTGKFVKLDDPDTFVWSIVIAFRSLQDASYHGLIANVPVATELSVNPLA
jgi:hypothetical protein